MNDTIEMVQAKAFRVTDASRPILQCFIVEEIPEDTKYVLASPEGYLFFNEDMAGRSPQGGLQIPHLSMLTYYDIEYPKDPED